MSIVAVKTNIPMYVLSSITDMEEKALMCGVDSFSPSRAPYTILHVFRVSGTAKITLINDSDLSMWLSSRATKIWGSLINYDSDRPHTASVTNNILAHQPFLWLDGLTCKFS